MEDRVAKYLMAVYSNAQPGRDADYMDWYENVHLGDIRAIPGVLNGRVFEAIPASPAQPSATYLALYDLELDDPMTVLQEIGRRGQSGEMKMTDAVDSATAKITFMKQNF